MYTIPKTPLEMSTAGAETDTYTQTHTHTHTQGPVITI